MTSAYAIEFFIYVQNFAFAGVEPRAKDDPVLKKNLFVVPSQA